VIHPATGRSGPFVAVDLASIPPTLAAAELFGTARGAFSGAVARAGRFEAASGGTLLLDEIGNLPLEVQRMLLLALQDGRVTRLGETVPRPVDVKLVAATNADLAGAVATGAFRADLYARLNPAARLVLPPLRDRMDDLAELAATFVRRATGSGADRTLVASYLRAAGLPGEPVADLAIGAHPWPGNVRELEMVVRTAAVFALADAVHAVHEGRVAPGEPARTIPIPVRLVRELLTAGREGSGAPAGRSTAKGTWLDLRPATTLHAVARSLEEQVYRKLFAETGGDFAAMARRLLGDSSPAAQRRVRLRFNQLGLKARG
jgi:DNA-binding NtrC family response regulator